MRTLGSVYNFKFPAEVIRPAALLLASLVSAALSLQAAPVHSRSEVRAQEALPSSAELSPDAVRTLPASLIENRGHLDPAVRFYAQASGKTVYFTPTGVTYALISRGDPHNKSRSPREAAARWAVKLNFEGANANAIIEGRAKQPGIVSYFTGKRSEWKTGLPVYGSIVYRDLWPGIDLQFDADVSHIKYKFVVRPGADPTQIRLAYSGAAIAVDPLGQLAISTPLGSFHDAAPFSYQDRDGARLPVASSYRIDSASENGGVYGFALGSYDRSATLVIDPSVTVYAGYIGGVGVDSAAAVAVDAAGNAYIAGETASASGFPAVAGPDTVFNGGNRDAFAAKISADGTALLYAGYLGGAADDYATGIAIDANGNAYVAGETRSNQSSFPVVGGPDLSFNGASDAFVAKINAAGTALLYSGYIGGAEIDTAHAIAVDSSGSASIAGDTFSTEATFPVAVGPDLTFNGVRDGFVVKVNASGSTLAYAGYIGGAQFDIARAIAVDGSGRAYVAGETGSSETSFPVRGGPDLTYNGGTRDAFVAQVAAGGAALSYAGYIGGAADDIAQAIAVNAAGEVFVAGETGSTEASFPVLRGPGMTYGGGVRDAFVAKVNGGGGSLFYSGYIGGAGTDIARAAALDNGGSLVVAGSTSSTEATFPVVIGPGLTFGGVRDAFASKVNPAGTGLLFSGYFGGSGDDAANAAALDAAGNLYLAGSSGSTEASLPVAVGPDLTANGSIDAFVAKINVGEPHITAEGVVNAASYKGGPIAAGEIISIFGTAIGPDDPLLARLDSNGRVATTLGSTTVFFGSDPGALFYVSDTQINVQVPYSVDGLSTVEIRIHHDGFETNTITVPVAPSAPGIFTSDASGSGQAAAVDINGNLNTAENAVGPGDIIIIFATGEGQTDPAGITGKLAAQPFPVPVLPVKLLIGGIEAQLLYAGAAPGFAGLLQLNAIVPAGIAPLNAAEGGAPPVAQSGSGIPVELIIGDNSSQPDVFLNFSGGTGIGVPIADPQSVTTNEDTPRNITLTGGDPADQPLTFSILSGPAHGSLSAFGTMTSTSASLTYTPALNYNGPDSFQFQVLDPDGNTASATVGITVLPVNDPPNAVDDSRSTDPGDSVVVSVLANDSDPDGDPLTVTAVGNPANGTATTNGTTVTYTPNSGFVGTDTFSYTISDGELTDSASISVRVRGSSNESPSAAAQNLMTEQGVPIVITLTGSDPDGDDLTYGIQSGPSNGTLSAITQITNGTATVTYTPNPGFFGIDQFTYVVTDEHGASSPGIITIQVKGVTDMAITKTGMPDPVLSGSMLSYNITVANLGPNDGPNVVVTDALPVTVTFVSATPSQGSCAGGAVVTCNLGTIPNGGGATIAIVVTVNTGLRSGIIANTASVASDLADLNLANNSATASTMVVNDPPVIGNPTVAAETVGNTQLKVAQVQAPQTAPEVFFQTDLLTLGNVTDINGDPLTFSVPSPLTTNGGGVTITNPATGEFLYTPPVGSIAPDSFTYEVADPGNPPVMGTVNITLIGRIWYVKNDHPGMSSGTSVSPFKTLADAEGASVAGDDIFVHFGDGTATGQGIGITLKDNQRLIGEGVALDIAAALNGGPAPTPLFPVGIHPLIDNSVGGNAVSVPSVPSNVIRGLNIRGDGDAVNGACVTPGDANIVVSDNTVRGAGFVGIRVSSLFGCNSVATVENNVISSTGSGIFASTGPGSLRLAANHNTEINSAADSGIEILGSPGTPVLINSFDSNTVSGQTSFSGIKIFDAVFDADPVSPVFEPVNGGNTIIGDPLMAAPQLLGGGLILGESGGPPRVQGELSFASLHINSSGPGLITRGASPLSPASPNATAGFGLTVADGSINATGSIAMHIQVSTINATFDSVNSSNSPGGGISLSESEGVVTINGGTISGTMSGAFQIAASTVDATYNGVLTQSTNFPAVLVINHNGTVTFGPDSTISATDGTGLQFNNADGTYNFNGTTTLNGGDAGIDILNGSSGTFTFSSNTSIFNPTAGAFNLNGGDANVTYNGSITQSNSAFALVVQNGHSGSLNFGAASTINATGDGGLAFQNADGTYTFEGTIAVNGAVSGISIHGASDGDFTFSSDSNINNTTGDAFAVDGGAAIVTYNGTIAQNANSARVVAITNRTGGSVTFGGPITSNAPGRGISITGGTAANSVAFNGAVNLGQTTPLTTAGVAVTGNHAAAEVHFNAAVNIATSGADGILGTAAGILTTTSGAISAANGTALSIAGLDFGPASLNFNTIEATNTGSQQGINLQNFTGTAKLGVVTLNTNTGTALNLLNGGTVATIPGSTITATAAQAIVANNVDFGFGSLHFNSINASSSAAPVSFTNTRGRANLMGGSLAAGADAAVIVNLTDNSAFELILSGTSLATATTNALAATAGGVSNLCLSAAGNSREGTALLLQQLTTGTFNVVQQDSATLQALNPSGMVVETGVIAYGQGCLSAPVPGDPFGTPPTANPDSGGTIPEGGMVDVNVTANDIDTDPGDAVFLSGITTPATFGTATILSPTTVRYIQNVTIGSDTMDSFVYQIVDKSGNTATATVTVNITNVNDPPMVGNATITYDALGNTALEVLEGGTQSPPSLFLDQTADSLIGKANISDADGPGPLTCTLTGTPPLGTVTFLPNSCDFTYVPPAGNRGDGTAAADDSFQYQVSDNAAPTPGTATGTVEINIAGLVWYVKNDAGAANTGTGTSADPFTTLADVDGTSDGPGGAGPSEVGDIIYVFRGDGTDTNQNAGISLRDQQKLRGSGAPLVATGIFNGVTDPVLLPVDPSGPPLISNAAGAAVLVATAADGDNSKTSIEVAGIHASGFYGVDVECSTANSTSVTVTNNMLTGSGSGSGLILAVSPVSGCLGNEIALDGNVAQAASGAAININAPLSTSTYVTHFSGNSVTPASGSTGINVVGAIFDANPATAVFEPVIGGATTIGASGDPVGGAGMVLGLPTAGFRVSGELVFTDLDIFATGTALNVNGAGVLSPASPSATTGFGLTTPAGSTLSSTTGAALVMDPLTASTVFDTANGTLVSLTDVAGTVNIPGGALSGATGMPTFLIDGGNAAITYGGSATAGSGGRVVDILDRTGGSATFGGAITSNSPGLGISVLGATAASSTTFNGNVDLGVGTALGSAGVNINHNSTTSTTTFANLDIVTSGATGLSAIGGGTLNVTTGTVGATNGTAVNISGTNASSFTLASVTQSGTAAGNAINISTSTGTKSFTVATIANTSGIGIALSNAGTVNIDGGAPTSSVSTTLGQAVSVANTALGMNFAAVSSNGGTNNISLNTATGSFIANGGALSGATGDAVNITGGSGTFSYAGTVGKSGTGQSIDISGHGAGATTFSGAITDTADGILLSTNTGTFAFNGGVSITNTGEAGFTATNSGTVSVNSTSVSTTVTTTNAAAVDIDSTTTNITFDSLSSTNSPDHGVDLTNLGANSVFNGGTTTITNANATAALTDGALRIATVGVGANIDFGTTAINSRNGTGIFIDSVSATAMSPSTIDFGAVTIPNPDNSAGYGIRIEDSGADVTIASATISNTIIGTATTYNAMTGRPTNDGDGDGIFLKNNTGEFSFTLNGGTFTNIADSAVDFRTTNNVTLNGITIGTAAGNGTDNAGLFGDIGTNLSVLNSNFAFIGNDVSPGTLQHDNGMTLRDISGTFTIQNTLLDGDDGYSTFQNSITLDQNRAVELANAGVNLNVVVTGSTIRFWDFQGLNLRFIGGSMNVDVGDNTVGNANTFTNINGAAVSTGPSSGATTNTHTTDVLRNSFTNVGIAVESFSSRGGNSTVRIVNNTVSTTISDAFRLAAFANGAVGALPNYSARVTGNTVTGLAGGAQGSGGGFGFFVAVEDNSNAQVLIENNSVTGHGMTGGSDNPLGMLATQHQRGGNMDITFSNNTAASMQNNFFGPMFLQVNGATGANSQCINFNANTYTNVKPGIFNFNNIYYIDLATTGDDNIEIGGFVDTPPATETEVANYLNGPETTTIVAGDVLFADPNAPPIGGTCLNANIPPAP